MSIFFLVASTRGRYDFAFAVLVKERGALRMIASLKASSVLVL